jgi:hypothetical protein
MTETDLFKRVLKGNEAAVKFMKDLAFCSQVLDDLVDKDKDVSAGTIENVFWLLLIDVPNNGFYRAHNQSLLPVMGQVLNDWFVANSMEAKHVQLAPLPGAEPKVWLDDQLLRVSYVLRDSMAQLLTHCTLLIGGYAWMRQHADLIRTFVHDENFDSYKESV